MNSCALVTSGSGKTHETTFATEDRATSPIARLAGLIRSNDRLLSDLKVLDNRLIEAKQYLEAPGANLLLGRCRFDRVRDQRSLVMTALRSNRIAAREFLATPVC